jgi:RHS repeat-associated protein
MSRPFLLFCTFIFALVTHINANVTYISVNLTVQNDTGSPIRVLAGHKLTLQRCSGPEADCVGTTWDCGCFAPFHAGPIPYTITFVGTIPCGAPVNVATTVSVESNHLTDGIWKVFDQEGSVTTIIGDPRNKTFVLGSKPSITLDATGCHYVNSQGDCPFAAPPIAVTVQHTSGYTFDFDDGGTDARWDGVNTITPGFKPGTCVLRVKGFCTPISLSVDLQEPPTVELPAELAVDDDTPVKATVKRCASSSQITWSIDDGGTGTTIDSDGWITAGTAPGFATVTASFDGVSACGKIELKECGCSSCDKEVENRSIDVSINLGSVRNGKIRGVLKLKEEDWAANLYSPTKLHFYHSAVDNPQFDITYSGESIQRICCAANKTEVFVSSTDSGSTHSTSIKVFVGADVADCLSSAPTRTAESEWVLAQNDAVSGTFTVTEYHNGETDNARIFVYTRTFDSTSTNLTLQVSGPKKGCDSESTGPLYKDEKSTQTSAGVTTVTHKKFTADCSGTFPVNPSYSESKSFKSSAGTKPISTIVGDGIFAKTNRFEYYTTTDENGAFNGRLAQMFGPSGGWERYKYDANGSITSILSQYKNSATNKLFSDFAVSTAKPHQLRETGYIRDVDATTGLEWQIESNTVKIAGITISTNWIIRYHSSSYFGKGNDFNNLSGLVTRLTSRNSYPSDLPLQRLYDQFTSKEDESLWDKRSKLPEARIILVGALNRILDGSSIYDATAFAGVQLSGETQFLLSQNPSGADRVRLNRLLLEDAFPTYINKKPDGDFIEERRATRNGVKYTDVSNELVRKTVSYSMNHPRFAGRPKQIWHQDGTMEFYTYSYNSSDKTLTTTNRTGQPNVGSTDIVNGTQTVTRVNFAGNIIWQEKREISSASDPGIVVKAETFTGSTLNNSNPQVEDALGRIWKRTYENDLVEKYTYSPCCNKLSTFENNEGTTSYEYDGRGRLWKVTRDGVTMQTDRDILGNVVKTTRIGPGGSPSKVIEIREYTNDGELHAIKTVPRNWFPGTSYAAADMLTTSIDEQWINKLTDETDNLTNVWHSKITTRPDNSQHVEQYWPDGSLEEVREKIDSTPNPGSRRKRYVNGAVSSIDSEIAIPGTVNAEKLESSTGNFNTNVTQNYFDGAGRLRMSRHSVFGKGFFAENKMLFNQAGQKIQEKNPDGIVTMFSYDGRGRLYDTTNVISAGEGTSRVTRKTYSVEPHDSDSHKWSRITTSVLLENGATKEVSLDDTALDPDGVSSVWLKRGGQVTKIDTTYDSGTEILKTITTFPDSSEDVVEQQHGRKIWNYRRIGTTEISRIKYDYDSLNRLRAVKECTTSDDSHWRKKTQYEYYSDDLVATNFVFVNDGTVALLTNIYSYDAMGRVTTNFLPGETDAVLTDYNKFGDVKKQSGPQTYPASFGYDLQGRLNSMTTWMTANDTTKAEVTGWTLDPFTGRVSTKTFNSGATKGYVNLYTKAGLLATNTSARGSSSKFVYNSAGELQSVDLGANGNLAYQYKYDRLGRLLETTNAYENSQNGGSTQLGKRSFSYDDSAANPYLLENETATSGLFAGLRLHYTYDNKGRRRSVSLQRGSGGSWTDTRLTHGYDYDGSSRLQTVFRSSDVTSLEGGGYLQKVAYTYKPYSSRINTKTFSDTPGGTPTPILDTAYEYDGLGRLHKDGSTKGMVDTIHNASGTKVINEQSPEFNLRGKVGRNLLLGGLYWTNDYNIRGELISSVKKLDSGSTEDLSGTGGVPGNYSDDTVFMAGQQFGYVYDDIGNRKSASFGGNWTGTGRRGTAFTPNKLNQYVSRQVSGTNDVIGTVEGGASAVSITMTGTIGTMQGATPITTPLATKYKNPSASYQPIGSDKYFWAEAKAPNGSGVISANVSVNSGSVPPHAGRMVYARTPEQIHYDKDGCVSDNSLWSEFRWNARNELTYMKSTNALPANDQKEIWFRYDGMGRRICKIVSGKDSDGTPYNKTNLFVYDGWNLLAELTLPVGSSTPQLVRSFVWGNDLSGSPQGAGGVGGLLMVVDYDSTGTEQAAYFVGYDDRGNVAELVGMDGVVAAQYEYGPFGEVIRATGSMAFRNPFRFSTKYSDDETDFVYYGYRYYDPSIGRWLSHDPIEETGGANLYGFVHNDPLTKVDALGLKDREKDWSPMKNIKSFFDVQLIPGHYSTDVLIAFNSGRDKNGCTICEHPRLAQIYLTIERQFLRRIARWAIWRLDTDKSSSPFYPFQDNFPGVAIMTDNPGFPGMYALNPQIQVWGAIQLFETCAVCTDGGKNNIIGCVNWGHSVAGFGSSTQWGDGHNINPVPPSWQFMALTGFYQ